MDYLMLVDSYPVGIKPATVGFWIVIDRYIAELCANPFTFAHLELCAAWLELLAV